MLERRLAHSVVLNDPGISPLQLVDGGKERAPSGRDVGNVKVQIILEVRQREIRRLGMRMWACYPHQILSRDLLKDFHRLRDSPPGIERITQPSISLLANLFTLIDLPCVRLLSSTC